MPKKGQPTFDQRASNSLYKETYPDLQVYGDSWLKYQDAAKHAELQADGWLERTLYRVFGAGVLGSIAFALDPLAPFLLNGDMFAYATRYRSRTSVVPHDWFFTDYEIIQHFRNYLVDYGIPTEEFLLEEHRNDLGTTQRTASYTETSYIRDTTFKSRKSGTSKTTSGDFPQLSDSVSVAKKETTGLPFGELVLQNTDFADSSPPVIYSKTEDKVYIDASQSMYDREVTYTYRSWAQGPIAYPDNNVLSDPNDLYAWAINFATSKVEELLPKCLGSKRLYNVFYQIGELKDLPQLIGGIKEMKALIAGILRKNFATKLFEADKILANQYLNNLFGVDSILQAADRLLRLPEKAAKRLNYLIRRNNKTTIGTTFQKYPDSGLSGLSPSFSYDLPWWASLEDVDFNYSTPSSIKMTVSQTIKFPTAAVPKFSDKNYRRLLGLTPTLKDLYDLIPFSWLVDWFADLGAYINAMDAINSDNQLIHYGFMTLVLDESFTHSYRVRVTDQYTVTDYLGATISTDSKDRLYDCSTILNRHYQQRCWMADLGDVKSVSYPDFGLSPLQKQILGALLTKFT